MKIYFAASTSALPKQKENYNTIISYLASSHELLDNWLLDKLSSRQTSLNSQEILLREASKIKQADLIVAEVTTPSLGVGYLIGQALANRKPILCLYDQTERRQNISDIVSGSTSSLLILKYYQPNNIISVIKKYLKNFKKPQLAKFNFLISPEIKQYLDWGAAKERTTRSEFLRHKIIKDLISNDKQYLEDLDHK